MRRTKAPPPSNFRNPFMLAASIIFITFAALFWGLLALVIYVFLTASLVLSYCCFWDADERERYCPHGLLHALIYNE
jgi:hypothetical protein